LSHGAITTGRTCAALEASFIGRLAAARGSTDGAVWVLAPTNLAAIHLRRQAARALGAVAGVEFLTLKDAARRVALLAMAADGLSPMPAGAAELALQRILDGVAPDSRFGAFRQFRNAAPALLGALRLLAGACWTPQILQEASGRARFRDDAAPQRLREMASIWREFERWKAEARFFDEDDLILRAAQPDTEPAQRPTTLFLYGFYDFTRAQRALVERLLSLAEESAAWLLYDEREGAPAPGFEYAEPTVQWLRETMAASVEPVRPADAAHDLGTLVEQLFGEREVLDEDDARTCLDAMDRTWDGSVRVADCPGEAAEAAHVVRAVLQAADEAGESVRVGVMLRGAQEAGGLLAEAFERAGVNCYQREGLPLAQSVPGRVALALLELAAGDAERAAVIEFLALARVRWPEDLSPTFLDRASRQAGITRGRRQWVERLRSRAAQLLREAERTEDEQAPARLRREAELCTAGAGFLEDFFQRTDVFAQKTWAGVARRVREVVGEFTAPDEPARDAVLDAIEEMARLDVAARPPDAGTVRWLLGRRLARLSRRKGRFGQAAVTVTSIMAARGTGFDVVIVPGLTEKNFPRHIPESSLLTELDREALNPLAGRLGAGPLPLQQARPSEERYLFRIAVGSARRALVLTYPRFEQNSGRPRIPSRFLADACSALVGFRMDAELLQQGLPAGVVERVPAAGRGMPANRLHLALDAVEYDAAVYAGRPDGQLRTGYMAQVSETFRRALELERARWGRDCFGPYDGKVRAPELLEALAAAARTPGEPVSPSRLETYARCPFEYFLKYVLGVQELEAPTEEFELPPLERGALVHDLLRALYEECLSGQPFGELSDEALADAVELAGAILDRLGRVHAANHPATWQAEREKTLEQVAALLAHEQKEHATARPVRFEHEFGFDSEGHRFELSGGGALSFRGRIDRVDRLPDGAIQVVDYKTGKAASYRRNSLAGGIQLQLPIYLLAACEALGASAGRALYLCVGEPKDVPEFTADELAKRMDEFRRALDLIIDGISGGNFFPLPGEDSSGRRYCSEYCPNAIVCSSARSKLAQMKAADPDLAGLRALRDIK